LKIIFDWGIQDGLLRANDGRFVIYERFILKSEGKARDHNDLLRALASKYRLSKDEVISRAYRFYWRRLDRDAVQISPVRKIDEDFAYDHKAEFVATVEKEFGGKPRRTESALFERALREHDDGVA